MLSNYLAAALRNLGRNRLHAALSIGGLALGIAAAILSGLALRNELTWNHIIPGHEDTYFVRFQVTWPGSSTVAGLSTSIGVASSVRTRVPGVEKVGRLFHAPPTPVRNGDVAAAEPIEWVDPEVFEMLRLPTFAGDPQDALKHPDGLVLPRVLARKYFSRDAPLGATLLIDDRPMTVRAVIHDIPDNTSDLWNRVYASTLATASPVAEADRQLQAGDAAGTPNQRPVLVQTLARLAKGQTPASISKELREAIMAVERSSFNQSTYEYSLVRLDEPHIDPIMRPGVRSRLAIIGVTGSLILLVAAINFVNLATARASTRALEVGVRKTAGASRFALVMQFLGEASLYVLVATILALGLAEVLIPHLNAFLQTGIQPHFWAEPRLLAWLAAGTAALALLAGSYPAFVLSSFKPAGVMKGNVTHSRSANLTRQILVTTQFAVLIGLSASAAIVFLQRQHAMSDTLRVPSDQHYVIDGARCDSPFSTAVAALPGVRGIACSSPGFLAQGLKLSMGREKDGAALEFTLASIDSRTLPHYGRKPLVGRFMRDGSAAGGQAVLNESALRLFKFTSPAAALGQRLPLAFMGVDRPEVIGVVEDFRVVPTDKPIGAVIYVHVPAQLTMLDVLLTGREIPETRAAIEALYRRTMKLAPPPSYFVDEYIENSYRSMLRQAQLFGGLASVAIVLACLGLIGLSTSATARRTKEIGVRKAMGAGKRQIVQLLLWQFTRPVLFASLIACPLTAWLMQRWLEQFAYRIDLSAWPFIGAAVLAVGIALITVAAHCYSVARAKPVRALRYE